MRIVKAAAIAGFAALGIATVVAQQKPADPNDPRINLKPGLRDAGVAARGMELVSTRPRPEGFYDPKNPAGLAMPGERPGNATPPAPPPPTAPQTGGGPPASTGPQPYAPNSAAPPGAGGLDFANSDLAFSGTHMVMGNFHGFNAYDIESAKSPRLLASVVCPGGQGDVSIYGNLLFMSVEQTRGRVDCGMQGVAEAISKERFRGVRIFDISDIRNPKQVAAVQTCRGSHTHTLVPKDKQTLYVYGSGTGGVRSGEELVDCSGGDPKENREHRALQHRRDRSAARRAREGARRQPPAHFRRREERQRRRPLGRRRSRPRHAAHQHDQPVPRHHRVSGGRPRCRRVLGQRHPDGHFGSGQPEAPRRGRRQELRLLAFGVVQQRRHQGDLHG